MTQHTFDDSPVPSAGTADNVVTGDVIGNKLDTVAGDSLVAHLKRINEGGHAIKTEPYNAASVTCTDSNGSGAYTPGGWEELDDGTGVPANPYKVVGICIDTPSGAQITEIGIGYGALASEVEVCNCHLEVATDAGGYQPIMVPACGAIPASTRLVARIGTAADNGTTLNVKAMIQEI